MEVLWGCLVFALFFLLGRRAHKRQYRGLAITCLLIGTLLDFFILGTAAVSHAYELEQNSDQPAGMVELLPQAK